MVIIIAFEVYNRLPSDGDLLIPAIELHEARLGQTPRLIASGAAFFPKKNEAAAKSRGQTSLHLQSYHQERRAQSPAKEALVPERPEMAHRLRGAHQRHQTPGTASPGADTETMTGRSAGIIADNLINLVRNQLQETRRLTQPPQIAPSPAPPTICQWFF
jgi:hypothetical protein